MDKWLHFRAARRAATLVKYLRVHMERLLLRKITHPQEDVSDNGRDLIQVPVVHSSCAENEWFLQLMAFFLRVDRREAPDPPAFSVCPLSICFS